MIGYNYVVALPLFFFVMGSVVMILNILGPNPMPNQTLTQWTPTMVMFLLIITIIGASLDICQAIVKLKS